jgi:2-methylcitrate dehydratase PrpD
VTPRSFDDEKLWNPQLRALIQKIEVVENADYTAAYARLPVEHRTRVTLTLADGKTLIVKRAATNTNCRRKKAIKKSTTSFVCCASMRSAAHALTRCSNRCGGLIPLKMWRCCRRHLPSPESINVER